MDMAAIDRIARNPLRIIGWGTVAALLLAPLVAMQFTSEVDWDETDFIVMGFIFGSLGLALEFMISRSTSTAYRIASGIAILAAFLLIWANLAVGMIGSENNPYNLLFGGVLAIALVGSIAARFRPTGMALACAVAGAVQMAIAVGGIAVDPRGAFFSSILGCLWLLAALLFRKSAEAPVQIPAAARRKGRAPELLPRPFHSPS
jgi:hypothetical protein